MKKLRFWESISLIIATVSFLIFLLRFDIKLDIINNICIISVVIFGGLGFLLRHLEFNKYINSLKI